jgi:PQQ-dependent dehydrogenase (s-GDH family)
MRRQLILALALAQTIFQGVASTQQPFAFRVVATGLQAPWEITWGPDNFLWVTERTGKRVLRVNPASGAIAEAVLINEVYPGSSWHEGLLGLALHPDLLKGAGRDYVYVAYTYDKDPGPALARRLKIRRYTFDRAKGVLVDPVDILTDLPAHDDHGGGRLRFGPDQKLYLTRGDNGSNWLANYCNTNHAQDLPTAAQIGAKDWSLYAGKILRINLDGSVPSDNPTLNGVRSHIYTYGHRNPQGLVFGPTGLIYESEHGPGTDDEVNLIQSGRNYGWPNIAGYRDDRVYVYANWSQSTVPCATLKFSEYGVPASVPKQKESEWKGTFEPPLRTFFTAPANFNPQTGGSSTIAPSSLEIYTVRSNGIPGWANSLLLPGMTRGRIYRMKLSDDGRSVVGENEELFRTANRYRDLEIGPDGRTIYLVTDPAGIGRTTDPSGASTETFANPGSIVEFKYQAQPAR